jgi:deoxyribodipyrimidine photo-lyase
VNARYAHGVVWLRRDLRLDDHVALFEAAQRCERVTCAFVLDPALLRGPRVGAPIVQFFFDSLREVRDALRALGSDLALREGDFATELRAVAAHAGATAVFYNEDDDPAMRERDARVTHELEATGVAVHAFTDQVYAAAGDVLKSDGTYYTVYTPYRRRWDAMTEAEPRRPVPSFRAARERLAPASTIDATRAVPRPEDYGHASSDRFPAGGSSAARTLLHHFIEGHAAAYADRRNLPALEGTSRLSPHLRAGTIGIRTCVDAALRARAAASRANGIDTWIGELTWRDFYAQLLVHAPRVAHEPFVHAAKTIAFRTDERAWQAWIDGTTGYPIVDAAMIQLNTTGWMHNRLRMIVASFLTKHLLIDYRAGERYFEQRLADADLAANNGGWQWSASTGTDAAPYFRVFNPTLQGQKFDPNGTFVRRMIPALANVPAKYIHDPWEMPPLIAAEAGCVVGRDYPEPIVDHAFARARALDVYGKALGRRVGGAAPIEATPPAPA